MHAYVDRRVAEGHACIDDEDTIVRHIGIVANGIVDGATLSERDVTRDDEAEYLAVDRVGEQRYAAGIGYLETGLDDAERMTKAMRTPILSHTHRLVRT